MTMRPYRREVIEAVGLAREQGLTVISLSDSPASPIARAAAHAFTVSVETPQFFPSSVSTIALLETLLSFVIASASPEIVEEVLAAGAATLAPMAAETIGECHERMGLAPRH